MQKKRIAWQRDIYFGEKIPCVNRAAELVRLLYAVSAEVSINPQLYATRDKVLWAYFEHSCFEAEAFLEDVYKRQGSHCRVFFDFGSHAPSRPDFRLAMSRS